MAKRVFKEDPLPGDAVAGGGRKRRACLLVNPVGGSVAKDHGEQVATIWTALRAAGIWTEIVETRPDEPPHLVAQRAVKEGFSMVIACGGDGTVGAVAKGLVGTDCPLGIVPMGTYNNFARALQLPRDLEGACRVLARGRVRRVDVGVANDGHFFLEAAGVGIDAQLFPLGEEIKSGNWRRLWQAAKLAYQAEPERIHFELDLPLSEAYRATATHRQREPSPFAGGEKRGLGPFGVHAHRRQQPLLREWFYGRARRVARRWSVERADLSRNFSKRELLKHFWSISRRRYAYSPKIDSFFATEIHITSKSDLPFHVDGYQVGRLPLHLRSLRRALKVIA